MSSWQQHYMFIVQSRPQYVISGNTWVSHYTLFKSEVFLPVAPNGKLTEQFLQFFFFFLLFSRIKAMGCNAVLSRIFVSILVLVKRN
jgi:hypothetical protein